MSIKVKLPLIISSTLLVIMLFNIVLSYYSTEDNLRTDSKLKMQITAKQLAIEVDQANTARGYAEKLIEDKLQLASMSIARDLPSDWNSITDTQLIHIAKRLDVSHISLFIPQGRNTTIVKSSNLADSGKEIGNWYEDYPQFQPFLDEALIARAQAKETSESFWAAPFKASMMSDSHAQRAYYYDNKRNYVIDAYIDNRDLDDYYRLTKIDDIVRKTVSVDPNILEVTGVYPEAFQRMAEQSTANQTLDHPSVQQSEDFIAFGTYNYSDMVMDLEAMDQAAAGKFTTYEAEIDGKRVMKSFVPIVGDPSYVISIVTDYQVISSVLHDQLANNLAISIVLLQLVIVCSYLIAGHILRPIQSILDKVNEVANGKFGVRLKVKSKDELGVLSRQINMMARNLSIYTNELKQAYEDNRSMREYLESFINQTSDAIHVIDLEGRVILANNAFSKLFGWEPEQIIGQQIDIIPENQLEVERLEREKLMSGELLMARETQRITTNERIIDVSVSTSAIKNDAGKCIAFASITRDVTEHKKMEELLRRSEKLTTVGQLAAGVAHEVRNPLTTLRGFLQLQQNNNVLNQNHVVLMLSELERINHIVSEFLILAKPQAVQFERKDVRFVLGDVVSLLDSQANMSNIYFNTSFVNTPCIVECEENHLKQVFINLIKNAFEAMPIGGTMKLQVDIHNSEYARIQIVDEGHGIPADNLPKLGQPFYTDKETGTGLGLMISQRIIHTHKGTMEITSTVNVGTNVTILLPLVLDEFQI